MVISDTEILTGSANFNTLAMALIEKSASKTIEADLACFLDLESGNECHAPLLLLATVQFQSLQKKLSKNFALPVQVYSKLCLQIEN